MLATNTKCLALLPLFVWLKGFINGTPNEPMKTTPEYLPLLKNSSDVIEN